MPASPSKQLNPMMVRMLGCLFWAAIGWTAAFFGIIREVGWLALFGASTMVVFCVLSFCFWVQLFLTRSRGSEPSSGNSDRTLQFPPGSPPSEASQTKLVQRRSLFSWFKNASFVVQAAIAFAAVFVFRGLGNFLGQPWFEYLGMAAFLLIGGTGAIYSLTRMLTDDLPSRIERKD